MSEVTALPLSPSHNLVMCYRHMPTPILYHRKVHTTTVHYHALTQRPAPPHAAPPSTCRGAHVVCASPAPCGQRRRLGNRSLRVAHSGWFIEGGPRRVVQRKVGLSGRRAATRSSSTPRLGPTTWETRSRRPLVRRASVDARLERHPRPRHARAASRLGLQVRTA